MKSIKKRYVVDEDNRRIAVQIDLETFAKIEQFVEDHALVEYIVETEDDETLDLEAAKIYYSELDKAPGLP